MKDTEAILLDGIQKMEQQAADLGLCSLPFSIIHDMVDDIIKERDALMAEKIPRPADFTDDGDYACPKCGVYFDITYNFCPVCGQPLVWADEIKH